MLKTYELGSGDSALTIAVDTETGRCYGIPSVTGAASGKTIEQYQEVEASSSMAVIVCANIEGNSSDEGQIALANTIRLEINPE